MQCGEIIIATLWKQNHKYQTGNVNLNEVILSLN